MESSSGKRKMDSANPDEGPSSKIPRPETPVSKACAFLTSMIQKEVNSQLNLGDPLFPDVSEDDLKSFEDVTKECDENPGKDILQELGIDILAQAVNQAGIDATTAGVTPTTNTCTTSSAPSTGGVCGAAPPSTPSPPVLLPERSVTPDLVSPRKKPRKTQRPFKVIIKPPVPPTPIMMPMIKREIKPDPDFTIQYRDTTIEPTSCIVISDSEEEEGEEVPQKQSESQPRQVQSSAASSSSSSSGSSSSSSRGCSPQVSPATQKAARMNPLLHRQQVQMEVHPPSSSQKDEDSSSSSSSSCSSASDSESESEETKSAPSCVSLTATGGVVRGAPGGSQNAGPRKKKSKRISELDNERVRNIMKDRNTPFSTPSAQTKRGRVRTEDVDRMFRNTTRSLEYKNLPFNIPSIHQVLEEAIKSCNSMQVNNKGIQLIYTRNHEVKSEVDAVRCRLGSMYNLSLSTPFLMEHTVPVTHPPDVCHRTAEACASGVKAVWDMKETHTHQLCPRSSDYRNMIIHGATPVDFLGALNMCLPLMQKFPKQVMLRIFSTNQSSFMLPIYESAAKAYAVGQFEEPAETTEDLDTLSMAIEAAIEDLRNKSQ
ncbi:regulatory protein IE2 [Panine betaherpesvirus 2]|uniref:Regulatory protein IE2 n=1 Tax=Panine betaherpesvirus 2 TaxID=188763 RepID=Q8QRY7_9BETA|nr:regulatory protein IE2 [Panine betaherpesvirus 2]AAM00751.1 regulatory protein IE2 [Panine betaherpesvirus 2]QXV67865.1 regulatory protein IE2 [Panine betaherpesvirus 2]